ERQPAGVAHVAQEEPHRREPVGPEPLGEVDLHLALLQLVARIDDQLSGPRSLQDGLDEAAAERAGAAGDEDDLAVEVQGGRRKSAQGVLRAGWVWFAQSSQVRVKRALTMIRQPDWPWIAASSWASSGW